METEKRKSKMIHILSNTRAFVTAEALSEALHLSTKSIYRLVKSINEDPGIEYQIISERGKGYRLQLESAQERFSKPLIENSGFSPVERRNLVMEELLLISPKDRNVYDIYRPFYVSENVINNDEKLIGALLEPFDIKISRKNRMIKVTGSERNIRRALQEQVEYTRDIRLDDLRATSETFNRYDAEFVLRQLRFVENQLGLTIPHPYNINIFSHLYILLQRFRSTGRIAHFEELTENEKKQLQEDPELLAIAKKIIANSECFLHTSLPESELFFMYQYLVSSRVQKPMLEKNEWSQEVREISDSFIREMSTILNRPIAGDALFNQLAGHIKPMLNRLRHGIEVKNTLLEQIKLAYPKIFQSVHQTGKNISIAHHLPILSEDEVGFITLYFAQAVEASPDQVKILIVCTTGIGTSELLRVKILKRFGEIQILSVLASRDIDEALEEYPETEAIISTVQLECNRALPVIIVSGMLTLEDQQRLETMIVGLRHG